MKTVILVAVLTSLAGVAGLLVPSGAVAPPAISEQLDRVVDRAEDQRTYPAIRRVVRLHRGSPRSHVLVLRDDSQRPGGIPHELSLPPSDELRVYDEVRGRLVLRFAIHPQNPGEVQQGPDGDEPGYRIDVASAVDVDGDGNSELLVSFARRSNASGLLPVTALLRWDAATNHYRFDPVLTQAPRLRKPRGLTSDALDGYLKPSVVIDQLSDRRIVGFPADEVILRRAFRGAVLVAGFAETSPRGFTGRYEVFGSFISVEGGGPQLTLCSPGNRHLFANVSTPADLDDALVDTVIDPRQPHGCGGP